uniref:Uncharacterized protein n=1 Tax=Oryza brachyantha TaxID=4533 RepID=J3L2J0_ORYBR
MLSDTNYDVWAVKMKLILRHLSVWAVIIGEGLSAKEEKDIEVLIVISQAMLDMMAIAARTRGLGAHREDEHRLSLKEKKNDNNGGGHDKAGCSGGRRRDNDDDDGASIDSNDIERRLGGAILMHETDVEIVVRAIQVAGLLVNYMRSFLVLTSELAISL